MEYTVTSNRKVCGKIYGDKLTEDDILNAGGNIEFLIASGHIKAENAPKALKAVKAVEEAPPVTQQEENFSAFNSQEIGDK